MQGSRHRVFASGADSDGAERSSASAKEDSCTDMQSVPRRRQVSFYDRVNDSEIKDTQVKLGTRQLDIRST